MEDLDEIGVSPPPSPPASQSPRLVSSSASQLRKPKDKQNVEVQAGANKAIANRRPSEPSHSYPCPRWPPSCCCYILPCSRPTCRGMLRALGPEAWGCLALLGAVLATAAGVPPFFIDDGAIFSCHSISVTMISTLTALLAPLSLGLLWRVRRTSVGLGAGQGSGLNVSLAVRNDETTAVRSHRPCGLSPALKLTSPAAWTEPAIAVLDPEGVKVAQGAQSSTVAKGATIDQRSQWRRSTALLPSGLFLQDRMPVAQTGFAEGAQVPLSDRSRDRPSQPNGELASGSPPARARRVGTARLLSLALSPPVPRLKRTRRVQPTSYKS